MQADVFDHNNDSDSPDVAVGEAPQQISHPAGGADLARRLQRQSRNMFRWRTPAVLLLVALLFTAATLYHYLIYLPQPDQPHRLTLLDDYFGLGLVGIVALAGLAVGLRLLRPFRLEGFSRLERGALALGLGWGIFSLGVLAIGLASLLYA